MVNDEKPSKETAGELDYDAAMDEWSHVEGLNQNRTRERISKSSTSDKGSQRTGQSGTDMLREGSKGTY